MTREVKRIVEARLHRSATGIVGRRLFPGPELAAPFPFCALEEIGPTDGEPGDAEGGHEDRQQSIQVVTSLLAGQLEYAFSTGARGVLHPGDVLWAVARGDSAYTEMVSEGAGRVPHRVHGLRFKVALPPGPGGTAPRAEKVGADRIPWLSVGGQAARARILAGEAFGVRAVVQPGSGVQAQDWMLDPDADVTIPLPDHLAAMIYVCSETAWVGEEGFGIRPGQLALMTQGGAIRLRRAASTLQPLRVLLLAGTRDRKEEVPTGDV